MITLKDFFPKFLIRKFSTNKPKRLYYCDREDPEKKRRLFLKICNQKDVEETCTTRIFRLD